MAFRFKSFWYSMSQSCLLLAMRSLRWDVIPGCWYVAFLIYSASQSSIISRAGPASTPGVRIHARHEAWLSIHTGSATVITRIAM